MKKQRSVLFCRGEAGGKIYFYANQPPIHPPRPSLNNHWSIIERSLSHLSSFGQCAFNVHSMLVQCWVNVRSILGQCVFVDGRGLGWLDGLFKHVVSRPPSPLHLVVFFMARQALHSNLTPQLLRERINIRILNCFFGLILLARRALFL